MTDNSSYTGAYTYAADGTRIRAQESNAANTDKWFQCDGVRPVLEGTLSGDTFTTVNRYTWEADSYYDPLVFASIGGSNRYYLYDGLGSTRQLLNDDQTVTDTYSYEAFGNSMGSSGSTPNPYRYVGSLGYYQTGSSLMHLGARYYLPEMGRFVQRDPVPWDRSYPYCHGNPVGLRDATGLSVWSPIADAAGWAWGHVRAPACALAAGAGFIAGSYGSGLSNRYKHCLVSCQIAQDCGKGIAEAAGLAKELIDYAAGSVGVGDFSQSAFQESDFADNATGRACPKKKDCNQWCQQQGLQPETPEGLPGPFYPYMPMWTAR